MTLEVFIIFFLLLAISSNIFCKCSIITDLPEAAQQIRNSLPEHAEYSQDLTAEEPTDEVGIHLLLSEQFELTANSL